MTAKKVGNLKVVSVEPLISNRPGAVPNPTYDRLVLESGDKVLGCKACTYTSTNAGSMFKHVKQQHADIQAPPAEPEETIPEPAQAPIVKAVMEMTVGELLEYVAFLESDGERPEALRERAETAEGRVAVLEAQLTAIKAALS